MSDEGGWAGTPARTRLVGRCGHRWQDNIKIDLKEIVWVCGLDFSGLG
jgi:hypothetical protein